MEADECVGTVLAVDPNVYGPNQTRRLTSSFRPWQTIAVPTGATLSNPFPVVRADTARGTVTAPGSLTTAFSVDGWGQPLRSVVRPGLTDSLVTTISRDPNGMPFIVTSPTGAADQYDFNTSGLLTKQVLAGQNAVDIAYQAFAKPQSVSGSQRPTINYALVPGKRALIQSMSIDGTITTQYSYDSLYRVQRILDPLGHKDTVGYHNLYGSLVHRELAGQHITDVFLDGIGRDSVVLSPPLPVQRTLYDQLNRVIRTRNDAQGSIPADSVFYDYDPLFLTNARPATSSSTTQTNALGRNAIGAVTTEADPSGNAHQYFYDDRGLIRRWMNMRGDSIVTQYDALLRPFVVTAWRSSTAVPTRADTFLYNVLQRITVGSNKHSRDSVFADPTGWIDSVVTRFKTDVNKRVRIAYRKDSNGRLDQVRVVPPSGIDSTTRGFSWSATQGTLTGASVNAFNFTMTYDGELLPSIFSQPGGVQRTDEQTTTHSDYLRRLSPTKVDTGLTRAANLDSLSRITSIIRPSGPDNFYVSTYRYDARGRLVVAADTFYSYAPNRCTTPPTNGDYGIKPCQSSPTPTKTQQYKDTVAFDLVDNIAYNAGHGGTGSPTYSNNRITSWPQNTFTTDTDGNVTTRTNTSTLVVTSYYWSPDGLLDSVTTPTQYVRYDYNAFGMLVRKWTSRTAPNPDRHFVWDQGHLALELNGALTQRVGEYAYLPGTDRPLAFLTGATFVNKTRVMYQDPQGSVIGLVGTDGALLASQKSSDPWGVTGTWSVGLVMPDTMRLLWQGLLAETAPTNLYYARARWYDPLTKRFLSPDPLGVSAGVNRYTFARGDPLNLDDPDGLRPCDAVEVFQGFGTIPDADAPDGTACIKIGGGQTLGTVTVRGDRNPSGASDTFGKRGGIPKLPDGSGGNFKPPEADDLPSCRSERFRGTHGLIGIQTFKGIVTWGIYMYDGTANDGPWSAAVYVNGKRKDGANQPYPPHGSLLPKDAPSGSVFSIQARHTDLFGFSYSSVPNGCVVP